MDAKKIVDKIVQNWYLYCWYDEPDNSKMFFELVKDEKEIQPFNRLESIEWKWKVTYDLIIQEVEHYWFFKSLQDAKDHYISIKNIEDIKKECEERIKAAEEWMVKCHSQGLQRIYNRTLWERIINKKV